jgi:hypothetical protein
MEWNPVHLIAKFVSASIRADPLDPIMSEQDHCPIGSQDCTFERGQVLTLTARIMRMIERSHAEENISPCPRCLRDTMLAVAALLQIESARLDGATLGKSPVRGRSLDDAFAEAARKQLQSVAQVAAGNVVQLKRQGSMM